MIANNSIVFSLRKSSVGYKTTVIEGNKGNDKTFTPRRP